jgi:hypothetical protein
MSHRFISGGDRQLPNLWAMKMLNYCHSGKADNINILGWLTNMMVNYIHCWHCVGILGRATST